MRRASTIICRWKADRGGAIIVPFALLLPIVVLLIGGAVDYGQASNQRSRLQSAVDKAALASARELGLSDARRENVPAVVQAVATALMAPALSGQQEATFETTVRDDPLEVHVVGRQTTMPYFGGSFGLVPIDLEVHAVARIVGSPNICVLALDPSAAGTISLEKNARVTGQNCAVFSNSTHGLSIKSKNSASLSASLICSAGGKDGATGNFAPEPLTDCPTFDDPLAGRPEPAVGACDPALPAKVDTSRALWPGTYCGGLDIGSGAVVSLDPGIYIIKDGPLIVRDGATLTGAGAGFYFTGNGALAKFERASSIDLAAPRDGQMAGLLMFEARSQDTRAIHEILSDDARNLLGTLYLPRGRLHIDANNPIADKSAYTAIVARKLTLYGGPHLVLNANYDLTDVPVPHGIRGTGQPVSLVK